MKKLSVILLVFVFFTGFTLLTSCGGGGGGGGSSSNLKPVNNTYDASSAVLDVTNVIYNAVLDKLDHGSYSGQVVSGISGTATVTGDYYFYSGVSCGSDCVRSYNDTSIEIVFNGFKATYPDNGTVTLTGTVNYSDNSSSRQSGLSYSSSGNISVEGNDVSFQQVIQGYSSTYGYKDTISFSGYGDLYDMSGSLTASSGNTYSS
jgi:hypothetical protein